MTDVWTLTGAERRALVADLADVPAERFDRPSLCPGWDVHDVLAHLVDDARTTPLGFVRRFVAARFDFDRSNADGVRRERAADPRATLDRFGAVVGRRTGAPAPLATRLVEIVVHGEDIRRPLGIDHEYAPEAVRGALDHQLATRVDRGGGAERAAGLRLGLADTGETIGAGATVRGTALAILLAVSGRPVRRGELTGDGADRFAVAEHG